MARLPKDAAWSISDYKFASPSSMIVTGATGMICAHFVHHILTTTNCQAHCIGISATDDLDAHRKVMENLPRWGLASSIPNKAYDRLTTHRDHIADSIFQFDSDVSLLKNYEDVYADNVGLHFLIGLARSPVPGNVKAFNQLSTWGVPHLQTRSTTQLLSSGYLTGEEETTNMKRGAESTLGYLECRWVCELLLYEAGRGGLPINIYRSCIVGTNASSHQGLDRTNINRRIVESALQTGLVPDFDSARGCGMSWIELDFLVKRIAFLPSRENSKNAAKVFNLVSDQHIKYDEFACVLGQSYNGEKVRVLQLELWAQAFRASNNYGDARRGSPVAT
ncbi:hypothetical protein AJ79_03633 [Helicocarpus griseus UAMH5409]|uniref:Thioester reductase (TE) domain-containing protein n=1 Tax=Helicocarpus griseus UAMH5409 TaxID=1447875 RepID=A0A2B7XXJ1_9EURO|nr:hypothetical protein AJ79_03633 [Helicocarpus griseus UAMH5409]